MASGPRAARLRRRGSPGSGFASANTIGRSAMPRSISARHGASHGEPDEHVGAAQRFGQRALVGGRREPPLPLVHAFRAALVDDAFRIAHQHVLAAHAQTDGMFGARNGARARAVEHHAHVFDLLLRDDERVQQRRAGDDGGAVLVVVEDRNLHRAPQFLLDDKTFRRLDVFEVDAAEGGFQKLARADDLPRIARGEFEVEYVDVGEAFEQNRLAFHHRLAGRGPDVAEPQHRGAVGDHRDQITLRCVAVDQRRVLLNFQTGHGDARRVSQTQVSLAVARFARSNRDLTCRIRGMVIQRIPPANVHDWRLAVLRGTGLPPAAPPAGRCAAYRRRTSTSRVLKIHWPARLSATT